MSEKLQLTTKYQQLLRDLKTTVEGLLNSQVANVWSIYGGLNRLHVDVEKIFKHGCKTSTNTTDSDYWHFIQGLEWLQPDTSNSTFAVDCECKAHIPQNIRNDRASIWLYRSLENHSLSQKLSWLLSDKTHLKACYQSQAFLGQEVYAEATLICLRAVERNQPCLISEIKPSLFLLNSSPREYYKVHRRCSSFPDSHLRSNRDGLRKQTGYSFDSSSHKTQEMNDVRTCADSIVIAERRVISGKLRAWNSTPNLGNTGSKTRSRSNTIAQSQTTPSTPNRATLPKKTPPSTTIKDEKPTGLTTSLKTEITIKKTPVRHVLIDNCDIIEHTHCVPSTSSHVDVKKSVRSPVRTLGSSAPEYSFLSSLSGISGEKDFKKHPKKTFIEDGGMSVLPMATGYFPRPMKGQTLTSFLMSSQFTRPNAELDRENAHFSISEAVISAMEQIKCRRSAKISEEQEDSDEEINHLKQRIRLRRKQKLEEKQRRVWASSLLSDGRTDTTTTEASPTSFSSSLGSTSTSLSSEDVDDLEIDEASNLSDNRGLSMSMASLYSEADLLQRPRGAPDGASDILSAEGVALSLISKFSEKQLPRASDLEWLVSEEDAPQALLPMPKSWPVSPDDGDEEAVTPLRGTREWAPPRPQIIFTLHPAVQRKVLMAKQNYRCAGCGMRVAQQYASKFRYCSYLGRFFCTGCHTNQLAIIPASVIQKWNFRRYPVSSFSYRLLEQMYTDPLFRIFDLNKNIARHSRNLQICRKYRQGLSYLKDFILTCRFAETIQDYLKSEHSYIIHDPDIYSLEDLVSVKNGELKCRLKQIVEMCCRHTSECELCFARGFICEICNNDDVLFPWQMRTVQRCSKCGCCYHLKCWQSTEICPRCQRFSKRRESSCTLTNVAV